MNFETAIQLVLDLTDNDDFKAIEKEVLEAVKETGTKAAVKLAEDILTNDFESNTVSYVWALADSFYSLDITKATWIAFAKSLVKSLEVVQAKKAIEASKAERKAQKAEQHKQTLIEVYQAVAGTPFEALVNQGAAKAVDIRYHNILFAIELETGLSIKKLLEVCKNKLEVRDGVIVCVECGHECDDCTCEEDKELDALEVDRLFAQSMEWLKGEAEHNQDLEVQEEAKELLNDLEGVNFSEMVADLEAEQVEEEPTKEIVSCEELALVNGLIERVQFTTGTKTRLLKAHLESAVINAEQLGFTKLEKLLEQAPTRKEQCLDYLKSVLGGLLQTLYFYNGVDHKLAAMSVKLGVEVNVSLSYFYRVDMAKCLGLSIEEAEPVIQYLAETGIIKKYNEHLYTGSINSLGGTPEGEACINQCNQCGANGVCSSQESPDIYNIKLEAPKYSTEELEKDILSTLETYKDLDPSNPVVSLGSLRVAISSHISEQVLESVVLKLVDKGLVKSSRSGSEWVYSVTDTRHQATQKGAVKLTEKEKELILKELEFNSKLTGVFFRKNFGCSMYVDPLAKELELTEFAQSVFKFVNQVKAEENTKQLRTINHRADLALEEANRQTKIAKQSVKKDSNIKRSQSIGSIKWTLDHGLMMVSLTNSNLPDTNKFIRRYLKTLGINAVGRTCINTGVLIFNEEATQEIIQTLFSKSPCDFSEALASSMLCQCSMGGLIRDGEGLAQFSVSGSVAVKDSDL